MSDFNTDPRIVKAWTALAVAAQKMVKDRRREMIEEAKLLAQAVQGLRASGWSQEQVADLLCITPEAAQHITTNGEVCQDCGGRNQFVYRAPDPLWAQVTGQAWQRDEDGGWRYHDGQRWVYEAEGTCIALLCPECFEQRAKALGLRLFWTCESDPLPGPDDRRSPDSRCYIIPTTGRREDAYVVHAQNCVAAGWKHHDDTCLDLVHWSGSRPEWAMPR